MTDQSTGVIPGNGTGIGDRAVDAAVAGGMRYLMEYKVVRAIVIIGTVLLIGFIAIRFIGRRAFRIGKGVTGYATSNEWGQWCGGMATALLVLGGLGYAAIYYGGRNEYVQSAARYVGIEPTPTGVYQAVETKLLGTPKTETDKSQKGVLTLPISTQSAETQRPAASSTSQLSVTKASDASFTNPRPKGSSDEFGLSPFGCAVTLLCVGLGLLFRPEIAKAWRARRRRRGIASEAGVVPTVVNALIEATIEESDDTAPVVHRWKPVPGEEFFGAIGLGEHGLVVVREGRALALIVPGVELDVSPTADHELLRQVLDGQYHFCHLYEDREGAKSVVADAELEKFPDAVSRIRDALLRVTASRHVYLSVALLVLGFARVSDALHEQAGTNSDANHMLETFRRAVQCAAEEIDDPSTLKQAHAWAFSNV